MAKSFKKYPAGGITTAPSDKGGKRWANRAFRRRTHQALQTMRLDRMPWSIRAWSCWSHMFPKDGKIWYGWRYHPVRK
jgi:hypothetical protein